MQVTINDNLHNFTTNPEGFDYTKPLTVALSDGAPEGGELQAALLESNEAADVVLSFQSTDQAEVNVEASENGGDWSAVDTIQLTAASPVARRYMLTPAVGALLQVRLRVLARRACKRVDVFSQVR